MTNFFEALGDTLLTGSSLAARSRAEARQKELDAQALKMQNLQAAIMQRGQDRQMAEDILSAGPGSRITPDQAQVVEKGGFGNRLAPVMQDVTEIDPNWVIPGLKVQGDGQQILPSFDQKRMIDADTRATEMHGLQTGDLRAQAGERDKVTQLRTLISSPEFFNQSPEKRQVIWSQANYSGQAPLSWKEMQERMDYENKLDMQKINAQGANALNVANIRGNSLTAGQEFSAVMRLRTAYLKETAVSREIERQYNIMQDGLEAARKGDLNAGSQAVLVTFQKILDPESVVRESEYARSPAGVAMLQRLQGFVDRIAKGGPGVPLSELEKFNQLASRFVEDARRSAATVKETSSRIGRTYGIEPSLITGEAGDPSAGITPPGSTATTTNPPPGNQSPAAPKKWSFEPQ